MSLIPLYKRRWFLWRFNFAGNNKTYLGLKVPGIFSDFNQLAAFVADFRESPQYQTLRKSVRLEPRWYLQTDGQTDGHDEANKQFSRL
jgi:hypothetical protein